MGLTIKVINYIYQTLYEKFIFPGYHLLRNDGLNNIFKETMSKENLSPNELQCLQKEKLLSLLRHAYLTVPYYKKQFESIGLVDVNDISIDFFRSLPLINKSIISIQIDEFISQESNCTDLIDNSTSGSSGTPFNFKTDKRFRQYCMAVVARNHKWTGVSIGDKKLWLWGAQIDIAKGERFKERVKNFLSHRVMLSSYAMSDENLFDYLEVIQRYKPALITSYPTPLSELANYKNSRANCSCSIKAIITSAEMLYPNQRDLIEKAFDVKVFNRYGSREFGDIAQEDKNHDGLRINSDHVYVEILDENGNECPAGKEGDLYITGLNNYGMPLIRYNIGDRASWPETQYYYKGMPFPLMKEIQGRVFETIEAPNGNKIGGTFWTILLRAKGGIKQFQVIQKTHQSIQIKYLPNEDYQQSNEKYYRSEIADKCGEQLQVDFIRVDKFELPSNGKHKLIIKKLES